MNDYQYWIDKLQLEAHPEGGFFRQVYKSEEQISQSCLPGRYDGDRAFCTSIYFLLTGENFSAFHKIRSDEAWHFYQGDPITIHMISPDGKYSKAQIGPDAKDHFQVVIPKEHYFAAQVDRKEAYALVGCTVAPGFEYGDFELVSRGKLLAAYPQHSTLIKQFTRS